MTTRPPYHPFSEIPPRVFETERLRLRAIEPSDRKLIFELYTGDPIASKYMSFPCAKKETDGDPFLRQVQASFTGSPTDAVFFSWLIQLKDTGEYVGSCGMDPHDGETVGGGYILNPRFWGRGIATEAWCALVRWAQTQPEVRRIVAWFHPDNAASGNVMRKSGMVCEGIQPKSKVLPNVSSEKIDTVVYAWERGRDGL